MRFYEFDLPKNQWVVDISNDAKQDPNWKEITPSESFRIGTNEWFRGVLNRL